MSRAGVTTSCAAASAPKQNTSSALESLRHRALFIRDLQNELTQVLASEEFQQRIRERFQPGNDVFAALEFASRHPTYHLACGLAVEGAIGKTRRGCEH